MPDSLADRLTAARTGPRKGPPCAISVVLAALPDRDREALQTALATPAGRDGYLTNVAIAEVICEQDGLQRVSRATVGRHRRGECYCAR